MTTAAAIAPSWAVRTFGTWVEQLSRRTLRADVVAGLLGAVLVLPQGIAFATLAGLPPSNTASYTAVLPCIVAALFGSSRHVMSGPTNANSLASSRCWRRWPRSAAPATSSSCWRSRCWSA